MCCLGPPFLKFSCCLSRPFSNLRARSCLCLCLARKVTNLPNAEKMYILPVLQKSTKFEDKWQWHSLIPSFSKPRPVWSNEICCFSMICGEFVEIPVESSESSSPRLPSQQIPNRQQSCLSEYRTLWLAGHVELWILNKTIIQLTLCS